VFKTETSYRMRSVLGTLVLTAFGAGALLPEIGYAQEEPVVYPAKGQNAQQQEKDRFECYSWAKKQTGFDPTQQAQATQPPASGQKEGAVRGAARGAAGGAIGGAIAGDAGTGAAAGAGVGAAAGAARKRRGEKEKEQAAAQQEAAAAGKKDTYNRAFGACMEGRGYTVK
jgi:hypothetical protein